MTNKPLKTVEEILESLEKRIRSSNRDTFLPNATPAENGAFAELARRSAKDVAQLEIYQLMLSLVGEEEKTLPENKYLTDYGNGRKDTLKLLRKKLSEHFNVEGEV